MHVGYLKHHSLPAIPCGCTSDGPERLRTGVMLGAHTHQEGTFHLSPGFQSIGTDPTHGVLRTLLAPQEQVSLGLKNDPLALETAAPIGERREI